MLLGGVEKPIKLLREHCEVMIAFSDLTEMINLTLEISVATHRELPVRADPTGEQERHHKQLWVTYGNLISQTSYVRDVAHLYRTSLRLLSRELDSFDSDHGASLGVRINRRRIDSKRVRRLVDAQVESHGISYAIGRLTRFSSSLLGRAIRS